MISSIEAYKTYLKAQGIEEAEDIKSCLDATGIEISIMYEDDVVHEGYYDSINEAINTLVSLSKFHPHLVK